MLAYQNTDALTATRTLTLTNGGAAHIAWTARADAAGFAAVVESLAGAKRAAVEAVVRGP